MKITIKQLKQDNILFAPQTVSEAVLVKDSESNILTLNQILDRKVENIITPVGSGLTSFKNGTSTYIIHPDVIKANPAPQSLKIKYNDKGHIVETIPTESLIVTVNNYNYTSYNGDKKDEINFGDDFKINQEHKIALTWQNI